MNIIFWQYLLPQHFISRLVRRLTTAKTPWFKDFLIRIFMRYYGISMHEALESNPQNYADLESFFIREFETATRPLVIGDATIASPVDGKISQFGKIRDNSLIQAKGQSFSLSALLAENVSSFNFTNGNFATIYLAPGNFHRVYSPLDVKLLKIVYVPGKLFSVNQRSAAKISNLYARNERVILFLQTTQGLMALVMVGAMIVSGIATTWTGKITKEETAGKIKIWDFAAQNIQLKKGAEVGYFTFGSTVILLFPANTMAWNNAFALNNDVKIGQLLGELFFAQDIFSSP